MIPAKNLLLAGGLGCLISLPLAAQQAPAGEDWTVPRTANGKPDLQGVWTNKTLTPLTRAREFAEQKTITAE